MFLSQIEKVIFIVWNSVYKEITSEETDSIAKIFRIFIMKGPGLNKEVLDFLSQLIANPEKVLFNLECSFLLVKTDFEKKNMLINKVIIIPIFIDVTNSDGSIIIEASTELNRRSLDLAGLRQTHRFRT